MKGWFLAGLAFLLCLGGLALPFLPWAQAEILGLSQTFPPERRTYAEYLCGFQLWGGVVSAAAFLAGLLLLVITGPLRPTPPWRSAALLALGVVALGAAIATLAFPPGPISYTPPAGRVVVGYAWAEPVPYRPVLALELLLSWGLTLTAAGELRRWVGRQAVTPRPSITAPGANS